MMPGMGNRDQASRGRARQGRSGGKSAGIAGGAVVESIESVDIESHRALLRASGS